MDSKPSKRIEDFFARYILERPDLVLTLKSKDGASVNIDGPFDCKVFEWGEMIIGPTYAKPRGKETNVHMHVPWTKVGDELLVRLGYFGTPHIEHNLRICFFKSPPPADGRGDELFWFYGYSSGEFVHPLCEKLPRLENSEFSALKRVIDIDAL